MMKGKRRAGGFGFWDFFVGGVEKMEIAHGFFKFAVEHGSFEDVFPIKNRDIPLPF